MCMHLYAQQNSDADTIVACKPAENAEISLAERVGFGTYPIVESS